MDLSTLISWPLALGAWGLRIAYKKDAPLRELTRRVRSEMHPGPERGRLRGQILAKRSRLYLGNFAMGFGGGVLFLLAIGVISLTFGAFDSLMWKISAIVNQ